ncbi:uncharacterized protein LOC111880258 [Lactuca sativa]|uniref:uncharacterized protein LOC111880258 n=1 Tax=Lactuca sativa TaxID=4236 RepID=UPI001C68FCA2|nr:uncharacterized protein LOC111880258 [Lactuca sativa]
MRLFNNVADRRYDLPSSGSMGCIVTGDDTISTTYDIIIHSQSDRPQLIKITRYMDTHMQGDVHSRADIIARVFNIKVHEFVRFLKQDKTFGEVEAYINHNNHHFQIYPFVDMLPSVFPILEQMKSNFSVMPMAIHNGISMLHAISNYLYTIEFQKRGLPHCHTLLWVNSSDRIKNPIDIDRYITAELSDPINEAELYETITSCMIHGPCGPLNEKAPCMRDGKCTKHFPRHFVDSTFFDREGYVRYKRSAYAHHTTRYGQVVDNGYVVPYNKRLCSRFRAHINVEYCGWNMLIKYLFKYISKGADRIRYTLQKAESTNQSSTALPTTSHNRPENEDICVVNEVQNFLDGRYICPHEAAWRILDFRIHQCHPVVQILTVHEENMQQWMFNEENTIPEVLSNPNSSITTLLAWFESNARDAKGHDLTYLDYPKSYKWEKSSKSWSRRIYESSKTVGRLVFVHPTSDELFYLRMLLCHQKGCTSFQDLRTVRGTIYPNFWATCNALGLIGDDIEWLTCFTEASIWATASQLRSLFCHLLLFCEVSNPRLLWDSACDKMKDDYLHTLKLQIPDKNVASAADIIEQQLLHDLDNILCSAVPSKSMGDFGLPVPSADVIGILRNRLLLEELSYDREGLMKEHNELVPKLNSDQRSVYNTVGSSIENKKQILMFVYGHGGTGKTFLWTTILSYFRSIGKIVLAVAASGIASLLLPSGTTTHSRFKIPIDLTDKKSCDIKKRSFLGELMQRTTLIIWDEAPMSDRRCFEFLDRSLRDVLDCDQQPFGGISMLLGGDFRQTLPVVPKSTRSEIIALTLPSSYLWPYFTVRILHTNMRLQSSDITTQNSMSTSTFARWLLAIGDRIIGIPDKDDPCD